MKKKDITADNMIWTLFEEHFQVRSIRRLVKSQYHSIINSWLPSYKKNEKRIEKEKAA